MGTKKTIENSKNRMSTPAFISSVIGVGFVIVIGAIIIGRSDKGQINVTATIQEANEKNTEAQGNSNGNVENVPEVFRSLPNGGLQPQAPQPESQQPIVVEPVASTTEATSTVTEGEATTETSPSVEITN